MIFLPELERCQTVPHRGDLLLLHGLWRELSSARAVVSLREIHGSIRDDSKLSVWFLIRLRSQRADCSAAGSVGAPTTTAVHGRTHPLPASS